MGIDCNGVRRTRYNRAPARGLDIIEEKNYYPFGLEHKGYNDVTSGNVNSVASKFGYNGKELNESLDLNVIEMDWRQYDPAIGRFNVVDSMAEFMYSNTPYHFSYNSPLFYSDPSGLCPDCGEPGEEGSTTTIDNGSIYVVENGEWVRQNEELDEVVIIIDKNNSESNNNEKNSSSFGGFHIKQSGNIARTTTPISIGLGLAGEGLSGTSSTFRLTTSTRGFSPKLYNSGWTGNQYTSTFKLSRVGKVLGGLGFGVGLFSDSYGLATYYNQGSNHPNAVSPGKFGVNTSMGVYGLAGGLGGAILSPIYFGLEAFYPGGASQALQDKADRDAQTSNILGRPFNSANQGTYSNFKW